jgi:hypothetical protein
MSSRLVKASAHSDSVIDVEVVEEEPPRESRGVAGTKGRGSCSCGGQASARHARPIWVSSVCVKEEIEGDRSRCAKELAEHARAEGIQDPTMYALSLGSIPSWAAQTAADETADAEDRDKGPATPA